MTAPTLPRYRAIERALRDIIMVSPPHSLLPSEAELCEQFGVSRMTARSAVTNLVNEGLVYRESGRGTFVSPPFTHRRADSLIRFSDEARSRGQAPSSLVVAARSRPATVEEARLLRLRTDSDLVEIKRVRLADRTAIALETAIFPGYLDALLTYDLTAASVHESLVELGRSPVRGHAHLSACCAMQEDASLLLVPLGSALLVEQRLIFDQYGRPLESTESRYVGDRYGLDVTFGVDNKTNVRPPHKDG